MLRVKSHSKVFCLQVKCFAVNTWLKHLFYRVFIKLGFQKCFIESTKCKDFKERVSTAITIDVSILISITQLLFWGHKIVIISEHLISLSIFSSQFCVNCSQLWDVFPEPFFSRCQSISKVDPLYPCTWQTSSLSTLSQFAMQSCFHVPLLKISIDPLEGKPSTVRKRTGNSWKKKWWRLWLVIVRNELRQPGKSGGGASG